MYDLIIIGASAAGCSAAIYAARRNLNFKIITKNIGGEVALSGVVENWPGIISIDGINLAKNFHNHAKHYNVVIEENQTVTEIEQKENYHVVKTVSDADEETTHQTKTVIIASGIHPRLLGVPNEEELRGRGVTYCTVCDGPLYRKKVTVTIGSGNAALESALMMSEIATKVYLISKYKNTPADLGGFPKGETVLIEKIKAKANVEVIYDADTTEIIGQDFVKGVKYTDKTTGQTKTLEVQGVMVHVGQIPNSGFVPQLKKDKTQQIEVDTKCQTSIKGIFAAGDVTNVAYKQIAIAAGQGVIAALSAIEYINRS